MNIKVIGKNIAISSNIKEEVVTTLEKLEKFKRFIFDDTNANIEIKSYPENIFKVTVNISLRHNNNIHCEEKHHDLSAAIKATIHPLEKQLNHLKEHYRSNQTESFNDILKQEEEKEFKKNKNEDL